MSLFLRETGPADAPPVVLLHGAGVSGWMWAPTAQALPAFHCLIPDLPGLGRSRSSGPFSVERAAERVAILIRERAPGGRAHLVGHSLGGAVAARVLADAPGLVDRAVLMGVTARAMPGFGPTLALMTLMTPVVRSAAMIRWSARAARVPPELFGEFREDQKRFTVVDLWRVMLAGAAFRPPVGLGLVDRPTLVLVGEREMPVNLRSARDLTEAIPSSVGRLVPAGAHAWFGERPQLLVETLAAWFEARALPQELRSL